jgi:hypothetical protein
MHFSFFALLMVMFAFFCLTEIAAHFWQPKPGVERKQLPHLEVHGFYMLNTHPFQICAK